MMCDFLEYSIVAPAHCVFVPKLCLTQEQLNLLGHDVNRQVHGFRTNQISWYLEKLGVRGLKKNRRHIGQSKEFF